MGGPGARPCGDPVYHSQGYQLRYGRLGHAGRSPLSVESNREPAAAAEDKKRETRNKTDRHHGTGLEANLNTSNHRRR